MPIINNANKEHINNKDNRNNITSNNITNKVNNIGRRPNTNYIVIKKSKIHGTGVYASRDILKGTKVIEYVGEKITKEESDRRAKLHFERHLKDKENKGAIYIFELDDTYDLDGYVDWNPAKYINHSCEPNCETENEDGRIWIVAIRDIKKDEEITYNYGFDLENYDEHPCFCGTKSCPGYIVDKKHWPELRKLIKLKKLN